MKNCLTWSMLLGFSDLFAARWSLHRDIASDQGSCHLPSIIESNDRFAVDRKKKCSTYANTLAYHYSSSKFHSV